MEKRQERRKPEKAERDGTLVADMGTTAIVAPEAIVAPVSVTGLQGVSVQNGGRAQVWRVGGHSKGNLVWCKDTAFQCGPTDTLTLTAVTVETPGRTLIFAGKPGAGGPGASWAYWAGRVRVNVYRAGMNATWRDDPPARLMSSLPFVSWR